MDNLVLSRVAAVLVDDVAGAVLDRLREPAPDRLHLVFRADGRVVHVAVSVRPEQPWIGKPPFREGAGRRDEARPPTPFAALCARALVGSKVESIFRDPVDRLATIRFAGGHRLVAELATHAANLVLVDPEGKTAASARSPRSGRERLRPGAPYVERGIPPGRRSVFEVAAEEIDGMVESAEAAGRDPVDVLRRQVFGIGTPGALLVLAESRATGRSPGEVLISRLEAIREGRIDPVIECPEDPSQADPALLRLLPWPFPEGSPRGTWTGADAAATAGLYHDAVERAAWAATRLDALRAILRREIDRTADAERKAQADLATHESPDRHRTWGEALLAGLTRARRTGDQALVPDPYDPEERWIEVPAPARLSLPAAAEEHFRRHRRAVRGLAAAEARSLAMRDRRRRLEELAARDDSTRSVEAACSLAAWMRDAGIPVDLERTTRSLRQRSERSLPRLEGVRLFTSADGLPILVGRSAKDNDRLTFRLAGPEDFWFHAHGFPGAHVVVRNPQRRPKPPEKTLLQAASVAAWYSDARGQGLVDVHWTRRKNVRRTRGASPGTVTLKRFESLRVRPLPEP